MAKNDTDKFLTRQEVQERVGLGRSAIYKLMRANGFPEPFRVGSTAVRWSEREIERWCATRQRARGAARHPVT